jgi:hypothetical protein
MIWTLALLLLTARPALSAPIDGEPEAVSPSPELTAALPVVRATPFAFRLPRADRRCLLPGATATGGEFAQPLQNVDADLVVEVVVDSAALSLVPIAKALERAGYSATFLVSANDALGLSASVRLLDGMGHEVGLLFDAAEAFSVTKPEVLERIDIARFWRRVRDDRRRLRKISGRAVRVVAVPEFPRALEVALDGLGQLSTVLLFDLDNRHAPRHIVGVNGVVGRAVVLPPGPYGEACPLGSELPAWTPAAFDRVSLTLLRASNRFARPIVRMGLSTARWSDEAEPLLSRYRVQVLEPAGVEIVLARKVVSGVGGLPTRTVRQAPTVLGTDVGRAVVSTDLSRAAAVLAAGGTLPQTLPGGLNLTEAYLALVRALAREQVPVGVQLWRLEPPAEAAPSLLPESGISLPVAEIRSLARTLEPVLLGQVPGFLEVDGRLLTAAEFLCAMARSLEADPNGVVRVEPTFSPDPFAPGLGWGISSGELAGPG